MSGEANYQRALENLRGASESQTEIAELRKVIEVQKHTIESLQVTVKIQRECLESQERTIAALEALAEIRSTAHAA
jgi:hypothetical protein